MKRVTVLATILIVLSVGMNIFTYYEKSLPIEWQGDLQYTYPGMFAGTALIVRPPGTEGLAIVDMDQAVFFVTEFGDPMNCAVLSLRTPSGTLHGECVEGHK